MNRNPFTEQITLTPEGVETLKKVQQKPGIKVNPNLDRLKEGERAFKAAFIDTEYPTPDDEERVRKQFREKAFAGAISLDSLNAPAENIRFTPEEIELLERAKEKVKCVRACRTEMTPFD